MNAAVTRNLIGARRAALQDLELAGRVPVSDLHTHKLNGLTRAAAEIATISEDMRNDPVCRMVVPMARASFALRAGRTEDFLRLS